MLVTISSINGPLEAIFAAGLKEILVIDGVTVDCPSSPGLPPIPALPVAVAGEAISAPSAAVPVKGKPGRKPGKVAGNTGSNPVASKEVSSKVQDASAPTTEARLTIRQRVIRALQSGPKTAAEVAAVLKMVGLDVDASQHLYLAKRDGLCTLDGDTYQVTNAGAVL